MLLDPEERKVPFQGMMSAEPLGFGVDGSGGASYRSGAYSHPHAGLGSTATPEGKKELIRPAADSIPGRVAPDGHQTPTVDLSFANIKILLIRRLKARGRSQLLQKPVRNALAQLME